LKTDLTPVEEKSFFKHYENVDYANAHSNVQATGYGTTKFKAKGGAQSFYLVLDT